MGKVEFPQFKIEKPGEKLETGIAEAIALAEKEKGLFAKFEERIVDLGRKFKRIPGKVSGVMALMMMFRATTAFAEANVEKPEMKGVALPAAVVERVDIRPQFDWKKFVKQIEISYGVEMPAQKEFEDKSIGFTKGRIRYEESAFYENMDEKEESFAFDRFFDSIEASKSSEEFFDKISKMDLSEEQKFYYLQLLGNMIVEGTYNWDMSENKDLVEVSNEEMFQALKAYLGGKEVAAGICGNIHTFMARTARQMGIDAWLQHGTSAGIPHIFMGAFAEINGKKQIVFLDYGTLVPTGTLNYQDALGIGERYHGRVNIFNNLAGEVDKVPVFVESLASEKAQEAAGIIEAEERIGELTEEGKFKTKEGLEINISQETKKIELSKNTFGISFYDYENAGNPYNSLESLQSARGQLRFERGGLGVGVGASILHLDINDLNNEAVSQDEIVGQITSDYIKSVKLNKGDYEKLKLNFGATLNTAFFYSFEVGQFVGGKAEGGLGVRLVYVNPKEAGKLWIGAEDIFQLNVNNLEDQDFIIQNTAQNFRFGGEMEVKEGVVTNLEAVLGRAKLERKMGLKAGLKTEKVKAEIEAQKKKSEMEKFIPSGLEIRGEAGYKTPIGEFNIYGAVLKEKYKEAPEEEEYEVGVRYRLVLWT